MSEISEVILEDCRLVHEEWLGRLVQGRLTLLYNFTSYAQHNSLRHRDALPAFFCVVQGSYPKSVALHMRGHR